MSAQHQSLIAANWKLNGSSDSLAIWWQHIAKTQVTLKSECTLLPPFTLLPVVATLSSQHVTADNLSWGAQNISDQTSGAYTGEVSAQHLLECSCRYVLIGHSERRQYYAEDDKQIARRFLHAQLSGLIPILCLGETLEQRQAGVTENIIESQLTTVLDYVASEGGALNLLKQQTVLAYEPLWAIGSGKACDPDEIKQVHYFLRNLWQRLGHGIDNIRIIYGGSVNVDNASSLAAEEEINGVLVGGASLDAEQFASICRCFG